MGAIDATRARAFLTERLGGDVGEVAAFQQQGEWSRAFAFSHDGQDLVVRFSALRPVSPVRQLRVSATGQPC